MTTITAPRGTTAHRPRTSTLVIAGLIVVILGVGAFVVSRFTSTSTATPASTTVTYTGGGGGNESHESHHAVRGHPDVIGKGLSTSVSGTAAAVAAEQVVAFQRQYLDGLLFQQQRLVDQGTPQAMKALTALGPQIAAAQKALDKAEKNVPVASPQPQPQPQTYTQN
jgi:hypothetical protein